MTQVVRVFVAGSKWSSMRPSSKRRKSSSGANGRPRDDTKNWHPELGLRVKKGPMALPHVVAPCDPFEELAERCGERGRDFLRRLDRIREAMDSVWEAPRLPWFTKHGVEHSDSLVRLLGESTAHLQTTPQYLDCGELFVLLAACYLHDVGMQAADIGKPLDQFEPSDHVKIRDTHPSLARELIVSRTRSRGVDEFELGLEDDDFLASIAMVAEAHGTATYERALRELLETRPQPLGVPLRGDLLGALLLMLDELDIQRARATFPKEAQFSDISTMYHFLNHYVAGVHVVDGVTPKQRRITVDFLFPLGSNQMRDDVRELILQKLLRQLRLTNPTVRRRTAGEMVWDEQISVHEARDGTGTQRTATAEVQRLIAREVIESRLVSRSSVLQILAQELDKPDGAVSVLELIVSDDTGEESATIIKWLTLQAEASGRTFVHLAPEVIQVGHGKRGLIERLNTQLGVEFSPDAGPARQTYAETARVKRPIIVIEAHGRDFSQTHPDIADLVSAGGATLVLIVPSSTQGRNQIALEPLSVAEIEEHLTKRLGYPLEDARIKARSLFLASAGRASGIIAALYADYEAAIVPAT